jgi:hypothetical protein
MLDNLTRQQRLLLVAAGVIACIVFIILTIYWGTAAPGHPRVKHMILFIVLAVLSLLVSWFAWPAEGTRGERRA